MKTIKKIIAVLALIFGAALFTGCEKNAGVSPAESGARVKSDRELGAAQFFVMNSAEVAIQEAFVGVAKSRRDLLLYDYALEGISNKDGAVYFADIVPGRYYFRASATVLGRSHMREGEILVHANRIEVLFVTFDDETQNMQ